MAVGNHRLSILVIVAYLGSMLVMASSRRMGRAIADRGARPQAGLRCLRARAPAIFP
jgi:hypothetical protein